MNFSPGGELTPFAFVRWRYPFAFRVAEGLIEIGYPLSTWSLVLSAKWKAIPSNNEQSSSADHSVRPVAREL